jgi:hypothetical protein
MEVMYRPTHLFGVNGGGRGISPVKHKGDWDCGQGTNQPAFFRFKALPKDVSDKWRHLNRNSSFWPNTQLAIATMDLRFS